MVKVFRLRARPQHNLQGNAEVFLTMSFASVHSTFVVILNSTTMAVTERMTKRSNLLVELELH